MTDFKKAMQTGLEAHAGNERAKAEILAVVEELSRQLREATEGRVTTKLKRLKRPVKSPVVAAALFGYVETYSGLVATAISVKAGNAVEAEEELCEFERSAYGYPVTLKYANSEDQSHDRVSLEAALAKMLEHPDVGASIARLLVTPPPTSHPDPTASGTPSSSTPNT